MQRCTNCGSTWPDTIRREWGKTIGVGVGSQPCCPAIVTADYEPITPGDARPGQLCRGPLVAEASPAAPAAAPGAVQ